MDIMAGVMPAVRALEWVALHCIIPVLAAVHPTSGPQATS